MNDHRLKVVASDHGLRPVRSAMRWVGVTSIAVAGSGPSPDFLGGRGAPFPLYWPTASKAERKPLAPTRCVSASRLQGSGDVFDRAEKDERVVLGGDEASSPPERGGFIVDGVDHERAAADETGGSDATLQRVLYQARPNSTSSPTDVGRELTQKQARHGIGRLAGADGPGQHIRHDGCRREAVIADDSSGLVDDQNRSKALLLVGERPGLEPMI